MVTLAETAPHRGSHATSSHRPAPTASLWRMGIGGRLALAAAAVVLLWSAIGLGLS